MPTRAHRLHSRRPQRLLALGLALGLAVTAAPSACVHNPPPDPNAAPEDPVGPTTVRVQNQGFADVTVYVYRGGSRVRLGVATGSSTAVFTIPKTIVQPATQLRFLASPIGGGRQPVSQEITVSPGDEIALVIPP